MTVMTSVMHSSL